MSTKQSTAHKTKSTTQTKTKQTNQEWRDERYGEYRDKLSDDALKEIVEEICDKEDDEKAAAALVLLMDEVERAQFDAGALENIVLVISRAAFKHTIHCNTAEQNMISAMRREFARKDLVN